MKVDLVVVGYIFSNDKVLLIHHKKLDLWFPVGGHIDKNETPDEALLREIHEEIGMVAEILGESDIPMAGNIKKSLATPFYVNVHSVGDHDHCCFCYVCRAINPEKIEINKDEVKDCDWFTKDDLSKDIVPLGIRNIGLKAFEVYNELDKKTDSK